MKKVEFKGTVRETTGSKGAVKLRKEGQVPCVLYGGESTSHLYMDERDLKKVIITPDLFNVAIDMDGTIVNTIIKDVQFHPVSDKIIHVDLLELSDDRFVTLNLPIKLIGNALGVRNGGKLNVPKRYVKIKGLPSAIPDYLELDITKLRIGHSLRIEDLKIQDFEFLDSTSDILAQVKVSRGALDEEEEEEEGTEEGSEGGDSKEGSDSPAAEASVPAEA